jgi:hypothetical protein
MGMKNVSQRRLSKSQKSYTNKSNWSIMKTLHFTKRNCLLCASALLIAGSIQAEQLYDFSYEGLYYKIKDDNTVSIVPKESVFENGVTKYVVSEVENYTYRPYVCDEESGIYYDVTEIADHAFEGSNLYDFTFNYGEESKLTKIGNSAFKDCTNLGSLSLPCSITTIGEDAFNGCTNLSIVGLQNFSAMSYSEWDYLTIETGAFYNTQKLTTVVLGNNNITLNKSEERGAIGDAFSTNDYRSDITFYTPSGNAVSDYRTFPIGTINCPSVTYTGNTPQLSPSFTSNIDGVSVLDSLGGIYATQSEITINVGSSYRGSAIIPIYKGFWIFSFRTNFTYEIKKAPLTITVPDYTRAYGEENPEFEITVSGYVNNENESVFSSGPEFYGDDMPTAESPVGVYQLSSYLYATSPENYELKWNIGTLTITPANQAITWESLSENYAVGATIELQATASSGLNVTYTSSNPEVATVDGNKLSLLSDGEVTITASQSGSENYNAAEDVQQTINVLISSGINSIGNNKECNFYGSNGNLIINSNNGMTVKVMSIDGKTVYVGNDHKIRLTPGIYIVKLGSNIFKVRI